MVMNDEALDGGFSIESLGEDATEHARRQLALLEKALGSSPDLSGAPALLDEAYRAAHSLKAAVDARRMPNVDRLARRVQDVVRASRSGALPATSELSAFLSSVARIARDALDAAAAGSAEPQSASTAAATLEEMLAQPGSWRAPSSLSGQPFRWAKIEAGRLASAGDAAAAARAAAAAFVHASKSSVLISEKVQSVLLTHEQAVKGLREILPRGLAAAARGESTTLVAAELATRLSALSMTAADFERSLSENGATVREAALLGTRAAEQAESAFSALRSVRLEALLDGLPRLARHAMREGSGMVKLVLESTEVEIDASRAAELSSLVKNCVYSVIRSLSSGNRRTKGRKAHSAPRILISAQAVERNLRLRFALEGAGPTAKILNAELALITQRAERAGGTIELEVRSGVVASMTLTIRSAAIVTSRSLEFIFARSGDAWYAIVASSVIECVEAGMATRDYMLNGERVPTMRMNDTRDPRQGVVVKTPRGAALLLFDSVGDREAALQITGGGDSEGVAGISGSVRRSDGTTARLVDLDVLLPGRR